MTIETTRNEYIESLEGNLTPEQAAQLLEMAEGDTGTLPDTDAQPGASTEQEQTEEPTDEAPVSDDDDAEVPGDESQLTPENTVILAKDGKHTIDYQKLLDSRQREQQWKERAETAEAAVVERDRLLVEAQQRADAGIAPTQTDKNVEFAQEAIRQGVDPAIFGDFSEEALANGVYEAALTVARQVIKEELAPFRQKQMLEEQDSHISRILAAHPDAQSIAQSKELEDWVRAQPRMLQPTLERVLHEGSADEVVELFDTFKQAQATDVTQKGPTPDPQAVKAAAKKALESAPKPVPNSLSDIPGGRPGGQTRFERLAETRDPHEMLDMMDELTPQQLEDYMNHHL